MSQRCKRLGDQLTQSDSYARYGRKRAKIGDGDSDFNSDDANDDSTDDDFDTEDDEQSEPDEYKRLAEEFFEDLKIDPTSGDELRNRYNKLTAAEQENWFQDQFNLLALLRLSPDTTYTKEHLEDEETLARGLRLLFHERNGRMTEYVRISPHITYDKLPKIVADTIAAKHVLEESELKRCYMSLQPL